MHFIEEPCISAEHSISWNGAAFLARNATSCQKYSKRSWQVISSDTRQNLSLKVLKTPQTGRSIPFVDPYMSRYVAASLATQGDLFTWCDRVFSSEDEDEREDERFRKALLAMLLAWLLQDPKPGPAREVEGTTHSSTQREKWRYFVTR